MAHLRAFIAALLLIVLSLPGLAAERAANAVFDGANLDLFPYLQSVETDKPAVSIKTSEDETGVLMELRANGSEPIHRWAVVTFTNTSAEARDLVVATPHQGFAGSGIFWPKPIGPRIQNIAAAGNASITPLRAVGFDAFALRIEPAAKLTVALELTRSGLEEIALWQRPAFESNAEQNGFYRGAVLGIAMLIGVITIALYAVRASAAFPFASVFVWASVGFIALESGYLPHLTEVLPEAYRLGPEIRAVVEGLMLTGLILCLVAFADLRKRRAVAGNLLLLAGGLSLVFPVYGLFEPAQASGIARICFAALAVAGFGVILALARDGGARARASFLSWAMIVAWTILAAVAALTPASDGVLKSLLSGSLILVLLTIGFTLAQFAFGRGFMAQRFLAEDARRALALTASQQCVWDWRVDDRILHVGEDIEKMLGLRKDALAKNTPEAWLELIHPSDRSAYLAAVEEAERRGQGSFSEEFRLRRADGTHRWFLLRARAIPGPEKRAARCIGTLSDVTSTRREQEQLLTDAVHDRVTGLPKRPLLIDRIERERASNDLASSKIYLLLIDLDRFKAVNDGLGHETGDGLLKIVGRRLTAIVGEHDTVARMPGDQFAILFHGDKPKRDVLPFTDKVRATVSKPVNMRPQEIFLTASIGVSALREPVQTAEGLLKDAAVALYEAKRRGKGTVEFFRSAMRDDRTELVVLEAELRRAIERNEIEVFYQPIARLNDMELAGFEALVRWRHKTLGLLGPESFIGLAETTGIIKDIGRYVLNEAGRQLGIWQRAFRPHDPLFVAVNVSSSQFLGAELIEDVKTMLAREDLVRDTLKLEITESIVMENPELVIQILDRLKKMGIGIACDDFGTGFSSLSNLRRLPFDTLKVDRSFLEAEQDDAKAAVILESIVLLAHDLDLLVVAEGIQSQEDVDRLGALDCDFGQGYFIGEPMTGKQVVDVLSGLPYAATRDKTVIAALWERMASYSREMKSQIESATPSRPQPQAAIPATGTIVQPPPVKVELPKPIIAPPPPKREDAKPLMPAPAKVEDSKPLFPAPAKPDDQKPPSPAQAKPDEPKAPVPKPAEIKESEAPAAPAAEAKVKPALPEPAPPPKPVTADLVKSEPAQPSPPNPGGAPRAPRLVTANAKSEEAPKPPDAAKPPDAGKPPVAAKPPVAEPVVADVAKAPAGEEAKSKPKAENGSHRRKKSRRKRPHKEQPPAQA